MIGLNDMRTEGTFEWSDGSTYENNGEFKWSWNEPNNHGKRGENCGEVVRIYKKLNDVPCKHTLPRMGLCEIVQREAKGDLIKSCE